MTKSACTRASLIPYPVIAAAVGGDPEAVSRVVRHYSGYIAALSTRTSYGPDGYPRPQVDEDLRGRLEAKLIISILDFDLSYPGPGAACSPFHAASRYSSLTKKARREASGAA